MENRKVPDVSHAGLLSAIRAGNLPDSTGNPDSVVKVKLDTVEDSAYLDVGDASFLYPNPEEAVEDFRKLLGAGMPYFFDLESEKELKKAIEKGNR